MFGNVNTLRVENRWNEYAVDTLEKLATPKSRCTTSNPKMDDNLI